MALMNVSGTLYAKDLFFEGSLMVKHRFVLRYGVKPNIHVGLMDSFMLHVGLASKAY